MATVAALGGFLFGYDSAVINGAVSAIGEVFNVESRPLGFAVASALRTASTRCAPSCRSSSSSSGWETKGKELEDMDDFMPAAH